MVDDGQVNFTSRPTATAEGVARFVSSRSTAAVAGGKVGVVAGGVAGVVEVVVGGDGGGVPGVVGVGVVGVGVVDGGVPVVGIISAATTSAASIERTLAVFATTPALSSVVVTVWCPEQVIEPPGGSVLAGHEGGASTLLSVSEMPVTVTVPVFVIR